MTIWLRCALTTNRSSAGMTDLNIQTLGLDKEGFLLDLSDWSPDIAVMLADNESITVTAAHWEILDLLRRFYQETEVAPAMRPFVKLVHEELGPEKGNSIYLMTLFGPSPALIAAKCAGLPRPTNCL